jgi:hypothetical protein
LTGLLAVAVAVLAVLVATVVVVQPQQVVLAVRHLQTTTQAQLFRILVVAVVVVLGTVELVVVVVRTLETVAIPQAMEPLPQPIVVAAVVAQAAMVAELLWVLAALVVQVVSWSVG